MKRIKVLIVEDELLIAETIKLFLLERGHTVLGIAISYEEAISLLEEVDPDLLLLDIRLYGQKSGIDLANHILASNRPIPYVILSSQYDPDIIEKAMYAGASGYLTKPISKETLWSTVELAVMKNDEAIANDQYIDIKINQGTQRVKLSDILYIKADHVYIEIVCTYKSYLARISLSNILKEIDLPHFLKCHRSYIINTKRIKRVNSTKVWIDDIELPLSSKYKEDITNAFQS